MKWQLLQNVYAIIVSIKLELNEWIPKSNRFSRLTFKCKIFKIFIHENSFGFTVRFPLRMFRSWYASILLLCRKHLLTTYLFLLLTSRNVSPEIFFLVGSKIFCTHFPGWPTFRTSLGLNEFISPKMFFLYAKHRVLLKTWRQIVEYLGHDLPDAQRTRKMFSALHKDFKF